MANFFPIVISVFISLPAFSATNTCLQGIVDAEDLLRGLTARQVACIAQAEKTKASLEGLCSSDQRQFSPEYKTYLNYQARYKEAEKALEVAWNDEASKSVALLQIRNIDSEWKAIGFKNEIQGLLFSLVQSKSNCKGR